MLLTKALERGACSLGGAVLVGVDPAYGRARRARMNRVTWAAWSAYGCNRGVLGTSYEQWLPVGGDWPVPSSVVRQLGEEARQVLTSDSRKFDVSVALI